MKVDIHNHILPKEWPDLKQVGTDRPAAHSWLNFNQPTAPVLLLLQHVMTDKLDNITQLRQMKKTAFMDLMEKLSFWSEVIFESETILFYYQCVLSVMSDVCVWVCVWLWPNVSPDAALNQRGPLPGLCCR